MAEVRLTEENIEIQSSSRDFVRSCSSCSRHIGGKPKKRKHTAVKFSVVVFAFCFKKSF